MARATRSSLQQDKAPQKQIDSKKRKRISDSADEPAQKLQRTDAPPYAATKPIDPEHAKQILHVLEMIDRQGLLDRVYPLEQSSSSAPAYSLRNLLSNSQEYSLASLRTAVQNLLPISAHPRAPTAAPTDQQQHFCDLALSLLDQASFHPIELGVESLLPQEPTEDDPASKFVAISNKRYALMQHLPAGPYWSSANLNLTSEPETGPADLKDLPTGHADLVVILPAPSVSASDVPKLGDYARAPVDPGRPKHHSAPTGPRRVTCGSFLDYGSFSTFAPCWVQNGREIGMRQLGEVLGQRGRLYREKVQVRERTVQDTIAAAKAAEMDKAAMVIETVEPPPPPEPAESEVDGLQDILAPDEIESLKAVLGNLELENAVQELLTRNRKALQRLGQLQVERHRAGTRPVKEGDEEWDVAHGILDSLTTLASLRPRSSAHPTAPLVPPPSVLHTLQCSLPRAATPGWHGTLPTPSTRPATALRDDTTVKVRPGVAAVPPAPVPATPAPTPAPAGGYAPYTYATPRAQGQQQYQYRPQAVQPQRSYYAAGNQVPYGYTGGDGMAYGTGYGAAVGGSGASTPVSMTMPIGKAVANTVLGKAGQGIGQWAYAAAGTGTQTPPVMPAHLRG
ncbi:hypothetical protein MSAN_00798500 [Mycena sanguinolenta]|uniref:Uncharacterized protein n=1 Tax=Mycena sanguinolenta TaxID=230812 RepID=A0A8H7DDA4_9AGAR|nr:hypothetical protein MSAN_00798500 [Mycena sanguinolenta]